MADWSTGKPFACRETMHTYTCMMYMCTYMENVYSTLALEKEREIVKEERALRKEKEAVCRYVHVDVSYTRMHVYVHLWQCPKPAVFRGSNVLCLLWDH